MINYQHLQRLNDGTKIHEIRAAAKLTEAIK